MAIQAESGLEKHLDLPHDMERINEDIVWSARDARLAKYKNRVTSTETVGPEDNPWLLIHTPTALLGIPQNGICNPEGLEGTDISYFVDHYSRMYSIIIVDDGNQYFYIPNVAMIEVGNQRVYTNSALQKFQESSGL